MTTTSQSPKPPSRNFIGTKSFRILVATVVLLGLCGAVGSGITSAQTTNTVNRAQTPFKAEVGAVIQALTGKINRKGEFTTARYERLAEALEQAHDDDAGSQLLKNAQDFARGKVGEDLFVAYLERTLKTAKQPEVPRARETMEKADKRSTESLTKASVATVRDWSKLKTDELRTLADKGDLEAQNALGDRYSQGSLAQARNDGEAVKWYRKAAEQGNARAQRRLGSMYEVGRGVAKDEEEAVKWYRKAAEQGYAQALDSLGYMYKWGRGVAKDEEEAEKWFRKAAEECRKAGERGDAHALLILGYMYKWGRGVARDEAEAEKWFRKAAEEYRKAAELGNVEAQINISYLYAEGRGVSKDEVEAVKWNRKAAEQGNAQALNNLGYSYENGRGVSKDVAEAIKWYRKAAEQGAPTAKASLEKLEGARR